MKALLGLVPPDAGARRGARHRRGPPPWEIRRRLGYMPELDCLPLDMTARDLVVHMAELRGLPRRAAVLRASEVLFQVGLEEERSRLIRTFSTGMKQRTKLAQAIVHSPELVVLDEPTNGLDPSGRDEMLSLVRRLSSDLGIAVLLSSHVLEDVTRTCDAVVVLRDGQVATTRAHRPAPGLTSEGVLVRVSGDLDAFAGLWRRAGSTPSVATTGLLVRGADAEALLDAVRDAAADAGVGLRELRAAGRTLEDALVDALGVSTDAGRSTMCGTSATRASGAAAGRRGVAGPLGRAALARRTPRLEGEGRADHAHAPGVRPGAHGPGRSARCSPSSSTGNLTDALPFSDYGDTVVESSCCSARSPPPSCCARTAATAPCSSTSRPPSAGASTWPARCWRR